MYIIRRNQYKRYKYNMYQMPIKVLDGKYKSKYNATTVKAVKRWREANPIKYRAQRNKDYANEKRWTQISREFRRILL